MKAFNVKCTSGTDIKYIRDEIHHLLSAATDNKADIKTRERKRTKVVQAASLRSVITGFSGLSVRAGVVGKCNLKTFTSGKCFSSFAQERIDSGKKKVTIHFLAKRSPVSIRPARFVIEEKKKNQMSKI